MKSARSSSSIEPLEARIAPATLLLGARGTAGTTNFDTVAADPKIPVFFNTLNPAGSVDTTAVGGDADTYYIKLKAGDQLLQFGGDNGGGFTPLLTVTKGTVVAFFVDGVNKLQVDQGELSGLSLGPGAAFTLNKDLDGTVMSNYDAKANRIEMANLLGPKQSIGGVVAGGAITGGIYAGGSISKVSVTGSVSDILTGQAANGVAFDLLRGAGNGGDGVLAIVPAVGEAGGSIKTVEVRAINSIIAGNGGDGGKGGSVTDVKILEDNNAITIRAGNGGKSVGGKSGGTGGDVAKVFISGASDTTAEFVQILAGNGGSTVAADTGGKGGNGGKAQDIFVGFESVGGKPVPSAGLLANLVEVGAGAGGDAKTGGKGGDLVNVKVLTQTKDLLVNPFSIAPYETSVHAGNGGAPNDLSGGAGGAGGAVKNVEVTNQNIDVSAGAGLLVAAGKGGQTVVPNPNAKGAAGGSVSTVTVLGFNADIFAGDGASGTAGGNAGSLTGVTILTQDVILANVVNLSAGTGGEGLNGNGGKGGDLKTVKMPNSNLKTFTVNLGDGGDGGKSTKGKGGNGGVVTGFDLIDDGNGTGPEFSGELFLRSGKGGDGDAGGGGGGEVSAITFFSQDFGANIFAGAGGNATLAGNGGAGAKVRNVNVTADGLFLGVQVNGFVESGLGGAAAGKGKGGAGGDMVLVNFNVDGDVKVHALGGGAGAGGASGGNGGSLIGVGAYSRDGSGEITAGDAGAGGSAAKGGSVAGTKSQLVALRAADDLTITAGDGTAGGDGGGISGVAYGSSFDGLRPVPAGNILLQAGDGSAGAKTAGKGGSILNISGSSSSGLGTSTLFLAGQGAGIATKGADGGSISEVVIAGAEDDGVAGNLVEIVFQAGDAGDSAAASKGAKGGQIKNLSVGLLDPDAVLRSVAAGNGGDADPVKGTGGVGGTIDGVRVLGGVDPVTLAKYSADIGYRSGKTYGFASMGGLFAGAAGAGAKAGLAGSVRNVSADSIAAIVAGRDDAPQAADVVEEIYLNGLQNLVAGINSPFTITMAGFGTTAPLTLLDPLSVQNAINALGGPAVVVTRTADSSFVITGAAFGDIPDITATENINRDVAEIESGNQTLLVKEFIPGTLVSPETQTFTPKTNGTYDVSINGDAPVTLNFGDPAPVVEAALNTLPSVIAAGMVTVSGTPAAGFQVKFNNNGDRPLFDISADVKEVQRIDTLGVGQFEIDTGFGITAGLAANATPMDVQNAINGLGGPQVTVAADPNDTTAYVVTFDNPGEQTGFVVTEFAPLTPMVVTPGGPAVREVQTLNFVPRAAFSAAEYAQANLVGAIVDPNEVNSAVFKFTPVGAPHVGFQLGDKPIDGLIVARFLDQATINFTPEASLIGGVFFDNDNKI